MAETSPGIETDSDSSEVEPYSVTETEYSVTTTSCDEPQSSPKGRFPCYFTCVIMIISYV